MANTARQSNRDETPVNVRAGEVTLQGDLAIPRDAEGIVLFAHGSGSSRFSSRNRYVAGVLQDGGLATLLIDLLTPDEEEVDLRTRHLRFDIGLLADRLAASAEWLSRNRDTAGLPIGLFGASTGGGAALVAAARRPDLIGAVVSRGGRPDLAGPALPHVKAPTLLLVGGDDVPVIEMNEEASDQMTAERHLEIIPGASHLFEEPGKLEIVAQMARDWFRRYLTR